MRDTRSVPAPSFSEPIAPVLGVSRRRQGGSRLRRPSATDFRRGLLNWALAGNLRSFPWRDSHDAYAVLVAEFLLQRTPSWKVLRVWSHLMQHYPTAAQLADAESNDVAAAGGPMERRPFIGRQTSGPDLHETTFGHQDSTRG